MFTGQIKFCNYPNPMGAEDPLSIQRWNIIVISIVITKETIWRLCAGEYTGTVGYTYGPFGDILFASFASFLSTIFLVFLTPSYTFSKPYINDNYIFGNVRLCNDQIIYSYRLCYFIESKYDTEEESSNCTQKDKTVKYSWHE